MKKTNLFDTHTHLHDEWFNEDREAVIENAHQSGVSLMVDIGTNMQSSYDAIALAEKYDFIYAAVGFHPHDASDYNEEAEKQLIELWNHPKNLAIGEIGLDYHYDYSPREVQKAVFIRQMELARQLNKKVIIHSREATEDTINILKMFPDVKGVLHCYSGSLETAKILIKMGYYLSFTGVVTYKNAAKSLEVVEWMPLDMLMAETDSPYLTPVPFRGKRNDSGKINLVVEKLAEIKGLSYEKITKITYDNAVRFFGLDKEITDEK